MHLTASSIFLLAITNCNIDRTIDSKKCGECVYVFRLIIKSPGVGFLLVSSCWWWGAFVAGNFNSTQDAKLSSLPFARRWETLRVLSPQHISRKRAEDTTALQVEAVQDVFLTGLSPRPLFKEASLKDAVNSVTEFTRRPEHLTRSSHCFLNTLFASPSLALSLSPFLSLFFSLQHLHFHAHVSAAEIDSRMRIAEVLMRNAFRRKGKVNSVLATDEGIAFIPFASIFT